MSQEDTDRVLWPTSTFLPSRTPAGPVQPQAASPPILADGTHALLPTLLRTVFNNASASRSEPPAIAFGHGLNNLLPTLRITPPDSASPILIELSDGTEPLAQITRDGKILVSRKLIILFNQVLRQGALPDGFGEAPIPLREPAPRELDL